MATLPMAQPQNPNQAAGASLSPMSYAATQGPLASTVPMPQLTPGAGVTGIGASTAGQPFGIPTTQFGTIPTSNTGINPIGTSVGSFQAPSISQGLDTTDGSKTITGDFKDTYGAGTGKALAGVLGTLGTSTNAAVEATNAEVLQAAGRQRADMQATEAARGISPDSSAHALAAGDFESQLSAHLASLDSQMELGGLDTIIKSLTGEGEAHGADTSAWDTFANVLDTGGKIAGDFVSAATGTGGGSLSSIGKSIKGALGMGGKGTTNAPDYSSEWDV